MILKSLKIKNFRSIKDLDLELPQSTMLFHGDIGSGKSSILKAIEFALFGTLKAGDLEGSSLLRRGEKSAEAELTFSINGKEYTIHRGLESKVRGGEVKISQPTGWLKEDGVQTKYTTTELRRKILTILNYSVSRYEKKGSIDIFRYTVYTPQEEIKKILEAKATERFEILKDVLEIEKYENTLKNLNTIKTDLNSAIRDKERDLKNLGTPEEEIPKKGVEKTSKKTEIETIKKEIITRQEALEQESAKLDTIRTDLNEFSIKIKDLETKNGQIQKDTELLEKNQAEITKQTDEIKKGKEVLERYSNEIKTKREVHERLLSSELLTGKSEADLYHSLKEYKNSHKEQYIERGIIKEKITDRESLLEKGICPLCEQKIHDKERFDRELRDTRKRVQDLTESLEGLGKRIEIIDEIDKNRLNLDNIGFKQHGIKNVLELYERREESLKKSQESMQKSVMENKNYIQNILQSHEIEDLRDFEKIGDGIHTKLDHQKEKVDLITKQIRRLDRSLGSSEEVLKNLEKELEKLTKDLQRKEHLEKNIGYISNVRDWTADGFPVLLKDIERMVLSTTAIHFNRHFKEWFQLMVEEENIDVQVNPENFDPLIIVDGYESPAGDLSGGEKSALSLAYRLALNKVINTKHQEVKTKELLILDEPTDGFSQQQINKMQDIFERLDTKQMIIISHERTLDSFVTDIFNFSKLNHVTKVTRE